MDLHLKNKHIIVCGATGGFGRGTLDALVEEGAYVYAVARTPDKLEELKQKYPSQVTIIEGDITQTTTQDNVLEKVKGQEFHGILVNAGGPPAKRTEETTMNDWDEAYQTIMRWKIEFTMKLLPIFKEQGYGRMLFVESSSIKQPIENLVLSTSLRMGMTGFIKTLSQEMVDTGITFNILAPGFHQTAAADRVVRKKAEQTNRPYDDTLNDMLQNLPMKKMGDPGHFGKLATWMFSPYADYMTGQIIAVDGGVVKSSI